MSNEKEDLTRLEDLSEYIHEINSEVDAQLEEANTPPPTPVELTDLEEEAPPFDLPAEDEIITPDEDFSTTEETFSQDTEPDFQISSSDLEDQTSLDATTDNSFTAEDNFAEPSDEDFPIAEDDFSSSSNEEFVTTSEDDFSNPSNEEFDSTTEDNFPDSNNEDFATTDNNNFQLTDNEPFTTDDDTEQEPTPKATSDEIEPQNDQTINDNLEAMTSTIAEPQPSSTPTATPETFKDVQNFAQHITYGKVTQGGNPPFTLMIKGIRYSDEIEDIKQILHEFGVLTETDEALITQSLERGTLFLSQLSEFVAIFLANKLRRFSGDISLGLSEMLSPAKSIDNQYKGLVTKQNLLKNIKYSADFPREQREKEMLFVTTTPTVEGFTITQYLGVVTADLIINHDEFIANTCKEHEVMTEDDTPQNFTLDTAVFYQDLVEQIKEKSYHLNASAAVGLAYTITPLPNIPTENNHPRYKIVATASAVQLTPIIESLQDKTNE